MSKIEKSQISTGLILFLIVLILIFSAYFLLSNTESTITVSEEGLDEILLPRSVEDDDEYPIEIQNNTTASPDLRGMPPAQLDLALLGTISSDNQEQSSATIQSRMQVTTYFIGDQISYTNATLLRIENDRVILLNEGVEQVLLIQGTASTNSSASNSEVTYKSREKYPPRTSSEIGNRPSKLEHIVAIDRRDDLTISPGMNPKLYRSVGFKKGDKLREVNGIDATDFDQLTLIDNAIGNTQMVEFVVMRDGRLLSLYLDIPTKALSLSD